MTQGNAVTVALHKVVKMQFSEMSGSSDTDYRIYTVVRVELEAEARNSKFVVQFAFIQLKVMWPISLFACHIHC